LQIFYYQACGEGKGEETNYPLNYGGGLGIHLTLSPIDFCRISSGALKIQYYAQRKIQRHILLEMT